MNLCDCFWYPGIYIKEPKLRIFAKAQGYLKRERKLNCKAISGTSKNISSCPNAHMLTGFSCSIPIQLHLVLCIWKMTKKLMAKYNFCINNFQESSSQQRSQMLKILSNIMTHSLIFFFFGKFALALWSVASSWLYTLYYFCTTFKKHQ